LEEGVMVAEEVVFPEAVSEEVAEETGDRKAKE
jgi:hypothetical protein